MKNSPQSPDVPPPGRGGKMKMKHKAMAGGAVGLVLLGAYFLGGLFDGFGLGKGSGLGTGGESGDPSKIVNSTEVPENEPVNTDVPPGVDPGKVVVILIDGENYKVLKSPEANSYDAANYRPASLDQIVKMAQDAEGDAGIKVRVGMRANSTHKSETELRQALLDARLPATAIYELDDTIP